MVTSDGESAVTAMHSLRPQLLFDGVAVGAKGVLWSPSYFTASCGGAPIDVLKAYIEQQKTPL